MRTRQHNTSWFILLLAAMTLLVFWPLYTGQYTLQGVAADRLIPMFSHIREALSLGEWPMWNKYQQQGISTSILPLYWNPMILLLGGLFSSPQNALNGLYLMLILIGGLGFFKLSGRILEDNRLALVGGLCYPLVGFFVVQSQYIDLISAAAWTPLLLYLIWQYLDQGKARYLFSLAIAYFLFTTSTSFGFVLSITTVMVSGLLYRYFGQGQSIRRSLFAFSALITAGFLVWRIYWIRWMSYIPISDLESKATSVNDNLQDLSSLFLPASTAITNQPLDVIASFHFHSFVGTVILLLAILSIFFSRTKTDLKLGFSCLFFLVLSLVATIVEVNHTEVSGTYGMPFTATMKILMVVSLLTLGLRGLQKLGTNTINDRRFMVIISLILIGVTYLLKETFSSGRSHDATSWFLQIDLLKSTLFILCTIAILWIRPSQIRLYLITALIIMELGLSNYLNQDSTLFNEYPSSAFSSQISFPEKMVIDVDLNNPIGLYSDHDFEIASLDRNTGTLFKRIVKDGYWPWETKVRKEHKAYDNWKRQLRYPLFYFSRDTSILSKPSYTNFDDPIVIRSQRDHQWDLSLLTRYEKHLVFNQNFDKNWQAYLDSELIPVTRTGTGMMKIPISPGLHTVSLIYRSDGLFHVFIVSMMTITLLIIIMAIQGYLPLSALVVLFPPLILFLSNMGHESTKNWEVISPKMLQDTPVFEFDYEGHSPFWFIRSWQITPENSYTGYRSESLNQEAEYSATLQIHKQALQNKKELLYEFHLYSEEPMEAGIVLKTYTEGDDSYNIKYITSLNTGQWKTITGRFSLPELKSPLVKADFYIWNYQKKDFLIDDIKVKLIP